MKICTLDRNNKKINGSFLIENRDAVTYPEIYPEVCSEEVCPDLLEEICKDYDIFVEIYNEFGIIEKDDDFINRIENLLIITDEKIYREKYEELYEYFNNHYPDYVVHITNSSNNIIFLSEIHYHHSMTEWNIGSRPELIMATISALHDDFKHQGHDFFNKLLREGYGFAKRTRNNIFDNHYFHFICKKQKSFHNNFYFISLREKKIIS